MHSPVIGILIYPGDPFWIQTYEAIQRANEKVGAELKVFNFAETFQVARSYDPYAVAEEILAHRLDALISTILPRATTETLLKAGLPVIQLGETTLRHPLLVTPIGLREAANLAGEYIAKQLNGKGQVVFVGAFLEDPLEEDRGESRLEGFSIAMKSFPDIHMEVVSAYWSYAPACEALREAFQHLRGPVDAIFGASDWVALAARDVGHEMGVLSPHTLLVGLNGDPLALEAIANGTMTATVETCAEDFGARALFVARDAASGLPFPPHIYHTIRLITAENVAATATRKLIAIAGLPNRLVGFNRENEVFRFHHLETSARIIQKIGAILDQEQLASTIAELIRESYGFNDVQVYLLHQDTQTLQPLIGNQAQISVEHSGLLDEVLKRNEAILIPDIAFSQRYQPDPSSPWIRSRVLLPIHIAQEVIGVLDLRRDQPTPSLLQQQQGLQLLADMLGVAIQNARLYQEARNAQNTAERANQLKTRLLANVGHEMRTPLNVILGYAQSALNRHKRSGHHDTELERDLQIISQSGEHLLRMINDLLDLSRAEIGALNMYFEWMDPRPIILEAFETFSRSEEQNPFIRWRVEIPERLPIIQADSARLKQILLNLLSNARKFTHEGEIVLSAHVEPPFLRLSVADTGEGISLEQQERLFEPFSASMGKRRPSGIGLGLSITRHLIALHGGTLTLESQPGKGSTFYIYLPLPGLTGKFSHHPEKQNHLPRAMFILSARGEISPTIQEICARQNLIPAFMRSPKDLESLYTHYHPVALAWDLACATAEDWMLYQWLYTQVDFSDLPFLLFNPATTEAGLVQVLTKPTRSDTLLEWISTLVPQERPERPFLIVDDDPHARMTYRQLIETYFPQTPILEASSGEEALRALEAKIPALILLDLLMPGMSGFEVLERLRRQPHTRTIPVVVVSGKLLTYADLQRLNYPYVTFQSKEILTENELKEVLQETLMQPQNGENTSPLIRQALAYLHQNYMHPISRKDIAQSVNLSENYFTSLFREEMHLTPWEYLTRLRISIACRLLRETSLSIKAIALQVGFSDPGYFTRVFNKLIGDSPQNYRKSASEQIFARTVNFPKPSS